MFPTTIGKSAIFVFMIGLIHNVEGQDLTDELLDLVAARLAEGATHSWEIGTRCQAIINFNVSAYSVFPTSPSIPPNLPAAGSLSLSQGTSAFDAFNTVLNITTTVINERPTQNPPNNAQPFFAGDGAAGDPASIGFAALLANWTGQNTGVDFEGAAKQQLNWIYNDVPRSKKGAISHRQSEVQLWADSVSMVPPFLAYYGLTTNNKTLLMDSYNQIKLYRDVLRDRNKSTTNLWFHIALGNVSNQDYGHWSTGNAWAVFGMSRVLATISQSQFSNVMKNQKKDLGNWIDEILDAMYKRVDLQSGLFRNYVSDTGSFLDGASSALVAAAVYRNAMMRNQVHHIPDAERARKAISNSTETPVSLESTMTTVTSSSSSDSSLSTSFSITSSDTSSGTPSPSASSASSTVTSPSTSTPAVQTLISSQSTFPHFTPDGWLQPVVDPLDWSLAGSQSPESQAFVLEMQSAYEAWAKAGKFGINEALSIKRPANWISIVAGFIVGCWSLMF